MSGKVIGGRDSFLVIPLALFFILVMPASRLNIRLKGTG
jgi:hypothetical protein